MLAQISQAGKPETDSYWVLLILIPLTEVFMVRKEIQLLSAGQRAYLSPLTGLRFLLTATVPVQLIRDVRRVTVESWESRGFIGRANDPSVDGVWLR